MRKEGSVDAAMVSIIIPAFNEEEGISPVLEALTHNPLLNGAEILVIDDGSSDGTSEQVSRFNGVKVIRHPVNRGYGSAIVTGVRAATRDIVVWFDADGQHRVEDLCSVVAALLEHGWDYCIGVRSSESYQEPRRKLGKWVLKKVVNLAVGKNVKDFNSGLRAFRKDILKRYLHLLPRGFGASTTTTLLMMERNYNGGEVQITVKKRMGASSVRQIRDGMRTLLLVLRILLLFKPLHFFGSIGLVTALLGFFYGVWITFSQGLGFPVLGAVLFLFGVQTIFWGLVVDQISAMRRERFDL